MAGKTLKDVTERLNKVSAGELLGALHRLALVHSARAETRAKNKTFPAALNVRSGRLKGSIAGRAKRSSAGVFISLSAGGGGKDVKYARIHEQDGVRGTERTIKAKKAQYLSIPVHEALRAKSGDARVPGPRDIEGLFFIESKKGNKLLVKSTDGQIEPWFLLRKSVTIKARPFLKPALDHTLKQMEPELASLLGKQELV
tara:strand:- start:568 stop:1167 length:600 start_codon:yes stop_codon:yes gene_type:complete